MDRPHPVLSPHYGLSLARLYTHGGGVWPMVVLHSRTTSWAFDPTGQQVDDPDATFTKAAEIGLHEIPDPFADIPAPANPGWTVTAPTPGMPTGRLRGPGGLVIEPLTSDWRSSFHWLLAAVDVDNRCRLLIAADIHLNENEGDVYLTAFQTAAAARRVAGATIPVVH